jgi:hypothetical protein
VLDDASHVTCRVVGVIFAEPLLLADVEALAAGADGEPVALWRAEPVCVVDVPSDGPSLPLDSAARRASAFAYWRADEVVTLQDQGPPVTDGGWSQALRDRFGQEWAASAPGVQFVGAALFVPDPAELDGATTTFAVPSYRTDDVGVLYLAQHDQALAAQFPLPEANCPPA